MIAAALIDNGTGPWLGFAVFGLLLAVSALGCWFGAPPDQRRAIVREVRRQRALRQFDRAQRRP